MMGQDFLDLHVWIMNFLHILIPLKEQNELEIFEIDKSLKKLIL